MKLFNQCISVSHISSMALCLTITACGSSGDDGDGGALSVLPAIAPLVLESLPSSLQSSAAFSVFGDDFITTPRGKRVELFSADSAAATAVAVMFKTGSYGKISGGTGSGYINSMLEDLDYRIDLVKDQFSGTAPNCFSATAVATEFDFSTVTDHTNTVQAALKLSLDLQCRSLFDTTNPGEQSGDGSGVVFGKNSDGSSYSLGLVLNEKDVASSAFGYVAKVSNSGTASETVDVIFAEGRPAGSSAGAKALVSRIKAQPQGGIYEMMLASPQPGAVSPMSGGNAGFGCGFYGVTNGTLVYMKGTYIDSGMSCSDTSGDNGAFEICLNASDLSSTAVSTCDALKASMTIVTASEADDFNYTKVTTADSAAIFNAIQFDTSAIDAATSETDE